MSRNLGIRHYTKRTGEKFAYAVPLSSKRGVRRGVQEGVMTTACEMKRKRVFWAAVRLSHAAERHWENKKSAKARNLRDRRELDLNDAVNRMAGCWRKR